MPTYTVTYDDATTARVRAADADAARVTVETMPPQVFTAPNGAMVRDADTRRTVASIARTFPPGDITTVSDAYAVGVAMLSGRTSRKVGHATYVRRLESGAVVLAYHDTDVVEWRPEGSIILRTGGWPTVTTKARMTDALRAAYPLTVVGSTLRNGNMPRKVTPWAVVSGRPWDGPTVAPFVDVPGAEPVDVITGENTYTGRLSWGSNVANVPPQTVTLSAELLRAHAMPACSIHGVIVGYTDATPAACWRCDSA